jgi:disulfide bond formation protein DsbB
LGKDLTTSQFVKDKSDAELVAFVKQGRPASDPANTTGVDMPPRGGNPALSDTDLANIVAFIRTLNK